MEAAAFNSCPPGPKSLQPCAACPPLKGCFEKIPMTDALLGPGLPGVEGSIGSMVPEPPKCGLQSISVRSAPSIDLSPGAEHLHVHMTQLDHAWQVLDTTVHTYAFEHVTRAA